MTTNYSTSGRMCALMRMLLVVFLSVLGSEYLLAQSVIDQESQIIYHIIDETQTVTIAANQPLNAFYGDLLLPKTVTDTNKESETYGQTFTVVSMDERAFNYLPLNSVTIEADIPAIPNYAFAGCWNLTSVILPETITSIGESAFSSCSSLQTIKLGKNITKIGTSAFEYCSAMTTADFSECSELEVLPKKVFYYCNGMTHLDLSGCTKLKQIGESAFEYCSKLNFPTFAEPSEITFEKWSFRYCKDLATVNLPANCHLRTFVFQESTIGELNFPRTGGDVFYYKNEAENIYISGESAFYNATLPTEFTIPNTVKYIPNTAFMYLKGTKKIIFEDNPELTIEKMAFAYDKNTYAWQKSLEELEFKGRVKYIGVWAFQFGKLVSVNLPPCETVDFEAFCQNHYLTSVTFPEEKITGLDNGIFADCTILESVVLPDWMTVIPNRTFVGCLKLATANIPPQCERIGEYAFSDTKLAFDTDRPFPETLTSIGAHAFHGCSIGDVYLPKALSTLAAYAFCNNASLNVLNFNELENLVEIENAAFMNCTSLKDITLPKNLMKLGNIINVYDTGGGEKKDKFCYGVFQGCTSLKKIEFNPGMTVGTDCFTKSGIEEIVWAENMRLSPCLFRFCQSLVSVDIPGYITTLPDECFFECLALTDIKFNEGTVNTGARTFMNCIATNVKFASSVKVIGEACFAHTGYHRFNPIPSHITTIEDFAFWRCANEGTLTIPKTVKHIGNGAFIDNDFTQIVFPEYTEEELVEGQAPIFIGENVFANNLCKHAKLPSWMKVVPTGLFCQDESDQAYIYRTMGYYYPNPAYKLTYEKRYDVLESIELAPGTIEIGDRAFANNTMLQIGTFPGTIINFGQQCFINGGKDLTFEEIEDGENTIKNELYLGTLVCPEGVVFESSAFNSAKLKTIEFQGCATFKDGALAGNKSIEEIALPECMTIITSGFFREWAKLRKVTFKGDNIVRIEKEAFKNCPNLDNSVLDLSKQKDLEYIGESAFAGCTALDGELDLSGLDKFTEIGIRAFEKVGITSVKWPNSPVKLGKWSFFMCPIKNLTVPDGMTLEYGCFAGGNKDTAMETVTFEDRTDDKAFYISPCSFIGRYGLKEVKLPEAKTIYLNANAFGNCNKLETVKWPENPECTYGVSSGIFRYCSSLKIDRIPENMTIIADSMFYSCGALENIDLPNVISVGSRAFDSSGLKSVHIGGKTNSYNYRCFYNCYNLVKFSADIAPTQYGQECFKACTKMEDFEVADPDAQKVKTIFESAFENCYALKSLPDIFADNCTTYPRAFLGCRALKTLKIPCKFSNGNKSTTAISTTLGRFYSCYDLMALDFVANGTVTMFKNDFEQWTTSAVTKPTYYLCPKLYGVSQVHGNVSSVSEFKNWYPTKENSNTRFFQPIKLLVPRATKYKFVKAGYESTNSSAGVKFFDVKEVKDPKFNLNGEIWSNFVVGKDINEYTGVLRWELEYSDFNEKEPTIIELWRSDGRTDEKVVKFEFQPPVLLADGVLDGAVETTDPTYSIAFEAYDKDNNKITNNLTYGSFYFERSTNKYDNVDLVAQKNLYFDASKTSRNGQSSKLGETSWFLYKDHFNSPKLDNIGVPVSYTYTVRMLNYEYEEWANTDNYEPDPITGLYWRNAQKRTGKEGEDWLISEPCVIHTSIAHPSIALDGMYTLDQVKADKKRTLDVTKVPQDVNYAINYTVPGDAIKHKLYSNDRLIVQKVQAFKLADRSQASDTINQRWGDEMEIYGRASGTITGPDYSIVPGKTAFQTVTYAGHRGKFGSPKVSLFGEPGVEVKASYYGAHNNHMHDDDWTMMYQSYVDIKALLDKFGYTEEYPISKNNHFIGLWRVSDATPTARIANPDVYADDESEPQSNEVLIWHSDGLQQHEYMEDCDICNAAGYDADNMVYTDAVPVPYKTLTKVHYVARLYVQKPDDPNTYAVAEATSNPLYLSEIFTSVDDLTDNVGAELMNDILANGELFDLSGIRISRPAKGSVFVALYGGKAYKLKMTK